LRLFFLFASWRNEATPQGDNNYICKMKTAVLKFGIISGLIFSTMVIIMILLEGGSGNFESGQGFNYLFMVGAYSMVFFGIREYRDKKLAGIISFNQAFRTGLLIVLIGAVFYTATWIIYQHFIDQDFTTRYTEYMVEQMKSSGKSTEQINSEVEAFRKNMAEYNNPATRAVYTFLEIFPLGLLISVLCALLMKKKVSV
jgi:hypothetical protein